MLRKVSLIFCVLMTVAQVALAAEPALLMLEDKLQTYQGKLAAANQDVCWLLAEDGKLERVELSNVVRYGKARRKFRPLSSSQLRDQLQRQWGTAYEVSGTQHYLVCAAKGQARQYTKLFEQVYRSFYVYCSTRGFRLQEPEFPLVAIVLPDYKAFRKYCLDDKIQPTKTLKGYYLRSSNRVALYNSGQQLAMQSSLPDDHTADPFAGLNITHQSIPTLSVDIIGSLQSERVSPIFATIEADLKQTIIHEAIHQVAFNTGLHSRIGETPKWVVEGMALVLESAGVWDRSSSQKSRINRERYLWFREYMKSRRPNQALTRFIASDKLFQSSVLDAYAEAWALTFFLLETRPAKYEQYLKLIQSNDPLITYSTKQRLADFQQVFGKDINWLNTSFERFINRL